MTQAAITAVDLQHVLPEFSIVDEIGNTPLIRIPVERLRPELTFSGQIFAKAEWLNPGGSVKDRPAWNMIKDGLLSGELTGDKTIIDASSGNTGIALAMIGSVLNIDVTICIPSNASEERVQMLRLYGAHLELTDPLEGTDGAILRARELVNAHPDRYYYTDQYNNPANWLAHYHHTSMEILRQTSGEITHFVAGLGTSGTFGGIARRFREERPDIELVSMQPDSPFHGLEGLKHMETAIVPGIYQEELAHMQLAVSTSEAQTVTRQLARHGILVGISSGANVAAALKLAEQIDDGYIVTILCDRGERYLSDSFWEDDK